MRLTVGRNTRLSAYCGFTILELICILAVIFFLFAMLMPSLSKVKRIATRVVCSSNMRSYGMTGMMYLDDSDDSFPDPNNWLYSMKSDTSEHPIGCRWHDWPMALHGEIMNDSPEYRGMMWEYVNEMSKATCPDFRDIAGDRPCENPDHNPQIDIRPQYNYTMNAYLGSDIEGGVREYAHVQKPATKFFFAEENSWSVRPDHPRYPARNLMAPLSAKALDNTALLIIPTPRAANCFATFHSTEGDFNSGSGNLVYIDGHVGSISVEQQLRQKMHGFEPTSRSRYEWEFSYSYEEKHFYPAGNLAWAWASEEPPPGGWDGQ